MKWEFHPAAEAEFIESAAYYEGEVGTCQPFSNRSADFM
jgi:hypothetical protein